MVSVANNGYEKIIHYLNENIETGSVIMFNRSGMKDERILDKVDKYFVTNSIHL